MSSCSRNNCYNKLFHVDLRDHIWSTSQQFTVGLGLGHREDITPSSSWKLPLSLCPITFYCTDAFLCLYLLCMLWDRQMDRYLGEDTGCQMIPTGWNAISVSCLLAHPHWLMGICNKEKLFSQQPINWRGKETVCPAGHSETLGETENNGSMYYEAGISWTALVSSATSGFTLVEIILWARRMY